MASSKNQHKNNQIWTPFVFAPGVPARSLKRPNGQARGNKRRTPLPEKKQGWGHRPRTKVSRMAARGWGYEVVFDYYAFWKYDQNTDPNQFLRNIDRQMKCRIIAARGKGGRTHIRIYVPSMAEIVQLRLLLDMEHVFRFYRLVESKPTAEDESNPIPDDPSAQS